MSNGKVRPNIIDAIKNNELQLIVNTPVSRDSVYEDSYIRMMAIKHKTPHVLAMAATKACVEGIRAILNKEVMPKAHNVMRAKPSCLSDMGWNPRVIII